MTHPNWREGSAEDVADKMDAHIKKHFNNTNFVFARVTLKTTEIIFTHKFERKVLVVATDRLAGADWWSRLRLEFDVYMKQGCPS